MNTILEVNGVNIIRRGMTNEEVKDQLFDLYGKYVNLTDKYFEIVRTLSEVEWQYEQILKNKGVEVIK